VTKKLTRRYAPVVEPLESRQLLHAVVDVRLAGGGQNVTVNTVGQVVNFDVFVTVTGENSTGSDDGLQFSIGSMLSSNITGGAALGSIALQPVSPFDSSGSSDGTQADLDADTDLDVGSNNNPSATGFFIARSGSMNTNGTVSGASNTFHIATGTFTVTSLLTGVQTNLIFRPRVGGGTAFSSVIQEDGGVPQNFTATSGASIVLKRAGAASVNGRVFNDKNANGIYDGNDTPITGFRVFLDKDFDGVLDSDELSKPVSTAGTYNFTGVPAGTYRVREVPRTGWRQTNPGTGFYQVTLAYGTALRNLSFANTDTVLIKGRVWLDSNQDKVINNAEVGLSGWYLYLDTNNNGQLDKTETWTRSDSKGNYRFFNLPAGTYTVRILQPTNYKLTKPPGGAYVLTLSAAQTISNKNFGEKRIVH
jgi:hypothetical protein